MNNQNNKILEILTSFEKKVIEDLNKSKNTTNEFINELLYILNKTRNLLTIVAEENDSKVYEGKQILLGILSRTHELFMGGIQMVANNNRHMSSMALRSLIETYGCLAWINTNPNRISNLLNVNISTGKFINAAKNDLKNEETKNFHADVST